MVESFNTHLSDVIASIIPSSGYQVYKVGLGLVQQIGQNKPETSVIKSLRIGKAFLKL